MNINDSHRNYLENEGIDYHFFYFLVFFDASIRDPFLMVLRT